MLPRSLLLLLFPFLLSSFVASSAFCDQPQLSRRILHQPFLPEQGSPQHSPPPRPPPPATPDIPFTPAATNNTPFFPVYSSPPPPSPSSFASFPANISSITLPESSSKSRPANSKLIPAAIAAVIAAVIVVSLAVVLHIRRRRRRSSSSSETKTQRSDSTIRPSYANNGSIPKLQRPSQTSSEFLYLGTLVNSHGAIDNSVMLQQNGRASSTADGSSAANSRKFDSPELRPLPPLSGQQNVRRNYRNGGDMGFCPADDGEEFYSPRGSLGGRSSSLGTGSASRRGFAAVEAEKLVHSSCTSSSSSSSGSDTPVRSVSPSISPPASMSPKVSRPKSPELVALQSVPPPPVPPPFSFFKRQEYRSATTHSTSPSSSPSPPSSSSPERGYSRSMESSARFSSGHILDSPVIIRSLVDQNVPASVPTPPPPRPPQSPVPPVSIPPPPPPPPPGKYWESPRTPSPAVIKMVNGGPPPLVTGLRPMSSLESPNRLISPMQLPGNSEPYEKDDDDTFELRNLSNGGEIEHGEEHPKPKLKPLHWDKVRASSDREMVWDQLKSSSFK